RVTNVRRRVDRLGDQRKRQQDVLNELARRATRPVEATEGRVDGPREGRAVDCLMPLDEQPGHFPSDRPVVVLPTDGPVPCATVATEPSFGYGACCGTTSTGDGERPTVFIATLPKATRATPVRL